MNVRTLLVAVSTLAAAAAAPAADKPAEKAGGRKIEFTTKSETARAMALETVRRIESFQGGARAAEAAKKAVEADPQFAFGHYLVGVNSFPASEAKPHLDRATALVAQASEGERRYLEAAALNRAQKPAEALEAFRKLAADYPGERMIQMMIGQIATGQGKLDEARAAFQKAMALDDSTPRVHGFLANIETLQGNYAGAREHFKHALRMSPENTAPGQVHFGMALTHLYEGKVDDALATLRGFLEEYRRTGGFPGLPEVFIWNAMGRIHLEHGRLEEALRSYEKGFESVPGSTASERDKKLWLGRLLHGRGRTLARMGRHAEAWKEAEKVKKMIDEGAEEGKEFLPAWHYLAGYIKLEAGETAAAIEHLKQADQNDPFNKLLLGRAYEKAGDKENAKKAYEAVMANTAPSLDRALAYPEAKKRLGVI